MKTCKTCKSPIQVIKLSIVLEHFSQKQNGSFATESDEFNRANNSPTKPFYSEYRVIAICAKNKNHFTGYTAKIGLGIKIDLEEAPTWVVEDTIRNYPLAHNIFKDKKHKITLI